MKILGFNFHKISAEKVKDFKKVNIATGINFTDVSKEKIEVIKDSDVFKLSFTFFVKFNQENETKAEINLSGVLILSANKEESKVLLDSWKKKSIPNSMKPALLNLVLKKCTVKALSLEEELNLPSHLPLPKVQVSAKK